MLVEDFTELLKSFHLVWFHFDWNAFYFSKFWNAEIQNASSYGTRFTAIRVITAHNHFPHTLDLPHHSFGIVNVIICRVVVNPGGLPLSAWDFLRNWVKNGSLWARKVLRENGLECRVSHKGISLGCYQDQIERIIWCIERMWSLVRLVIPQRAFGGLTKAQNPTVLPSSKSSKCSDTRMSL